MQVEEVFKVLDAHGELHLQQLYSHFSCKNSDDIRQKRLQDSIRQHLLTLKNQGKVINTTWGTWQVYTAKAGKLQGKEVKWLKVDDFPVFDSVTPLLAHNIRYHLGEPHREKGDPFHPRFLKAISEGWVHKTVQLKNGAIGYKSNKAYKTVDFTDRCQLRFSIATNGTVEIHTVFKEGFDKGFDFPGWQQFLERVDGWCRSWEGVELKHFKLLSVDICQDRRIIYHGSKITVQAFQGIFFQFYKIQEKGKEGIRSEMKLKNGAADNKDPAIVTGILKDSYERAEAISEGVVAKAVDRQLEKAQYADLVYRTDGRLKKINKKQKRLAKNLKTTVGIVFEQGKKSTYLVKKLHSLREEQETRFQQVQKIVEEPREPGGRLDESFKGELENITGALAEVAKNIEAFSKRLTNVENGLVPAMPGGPVTVSGAVPVITGPASNLTSNDPYSASMVEGFTPDLNDSGTISVDDLTYKSAPVPAVSPPVTAPRKPAGPILSPVRKRVVTKSSPAKPARSSIFPATAVHVSPQQSLIVTILYWEGIPLTPGEICKKMGIPQNSIRMQLQRLLDAKVIWKLPGKHYQLKQGVVIT